jgi:tRNA dimethylallyltransferase
MESQSNKLPLIVIVGETASGKSSLSLDLAKRFEGEIICADAMTVRRELEIGAAKPTHQDRSQVRHHLLDVAGPCDDFTAAVFKRLADQAVSEITTRRRLPILVGGTGLYIDSVIFDYSFLPPSEKSTRSLLNEMSIEELLALIVNKGFSLEGIDVRNKRRLVRLVEDAGVRPTRSPIRQNTLILGLSVGGSELLEKVTARLNEMLDVGLEVEVKNLSEKYGWDCEALKAIGYKEWRPYFEGLISLDEVKQKIIKSTLDLAKRQRTWFKRNRHINWISKSEEAVEMVTTFLNK